MQERKKKYAVQSVFHENILVFSFRASEYAAHFQSILVDLVHRKDKKS